MFSGWKLYILCQPRGASWSNGYALDCGAGGHEFKPWLAIFTNSFAIDEKRKERRGIVQKRAFVSGRCSDDRVSTTRSEEGMDVQKKASVGGIFIEC